MELHTITAHTHAHTHSTRIQSRQDVPACACVCAPIWTYACESSPSFAFSPITHLSIFTYLGRSCCLALGLGLGLSLGLGSGWSFCVLVWVLSLDLTTWNVASYCPKCSLLLLLSFLFTPHAQWCEIEEYGVFFEYLGNNIWDSAVSPSLQSSHYIWRYNLISLKLEQIKS